MFDDSVQADDQKGREQTFAEPDAADVTDAACPTCQGSRLNAMARAVRFAGVGIADIAALSVTDVRRWVESRTFEPRVGVSGVHVLDAQAARFADVSVASPQRWQRSASPVQSTTVFAANAPQPDLFSTTTCVIAPSAARATSTTALS